MGKQLRATKKAKTTKASGSGLLSQFGKPSTRKKNCSLLTRQRPLAGTLALLIAAVCVVGGYVLISHSLAATAPPQSYAIVSGYANRCLDDYDNKSANKNPVDLYNCNNTTAQQWSINTNGQLMIHGKCMDILNGGKTDGQVIDLYACKSASDKTIANQEWYVTKNNSLASRLNNKCLQAPLNKNGEQLQMWD